MCFRCRLEDHFTANSPKPNTSDKNVHWNTENPKTCACRSTKIVKTLENSTDQTDSQKIYIYMTRMYSNVEIPRRYFGDSLQFTNCILDSGATFHMTPEIFILYRDHL